MEKCWKSSTRSTPKIFTFGKIHLLKWKQIEVNPWVLKKGTKGLWNPVDQLWGVIARGVGNQSHLQNVEDCMDAIRQELCKPSIRDWLGTNVEVNIWKLSATRDWRHTLPNLGVKLEGGLLRDDQGNHLFLSMLRRGWGFYSKFSSTLTVSKFPFGLIHPKKTFHQFPRYSVFPPCFEKKHGTCGFFRGWTQVENWHLKSRICYYIIAF